MFNPSTEEIKEMIRKEFEKQSSSHLNVKLIIEELPILPAMIEGGVFDPIPTWHIQFTQNDSGKSLNFLLGDEKKYSGEESMRQDIAGKVHEFLNL